MVKSDSTQAVTLSWQAVSLDGFLTIPQDATGIVVFVHGSGSSRHSPRNQRVAEILREENLGTLLIDLLMAEEEKEDIRTQALRFDIELLASRVVGIIDWLQAGALTEHLDVGVMGSSTGAAAALIGAAQRASEVKAAVSRGGRPDLAEGWLSKVMAPTLLIVGGDDLAVLELNQQALALLPCAKRLEVIPRATHLFEEPGTLEQAAKAARTWFTRYL